MQGRLQRDLLLIPNRITLLENFILGLKPGKKLLILEHIRFHNSSRGKLQDVMNPVWKMVADGCNLNRPTDHLLAESGFGLVWEEHFKIGIPF
jgi:hypothetical protein